MDVFAFLFVPAPVTVVSTVVLLVLFAPIVRPLPFCTSLLHTIPVDMFPGDELFGSVKEVVISSLGVVVVGCGDVGVPVCAFNEPRGIMVLTLESVSVKETPPLLTAYAHRY